MNAQIRYAKTVDGVNIAYATFGLGPPLVFVPDMPFSHLGFMNILFDRQEWAKFEARRTVIRFDPRGMGLSERDIKEFSVEKWVLDIEAVVDALGLENFALSGGSSGGPVAIAYAAAHPERVTHLILQNTGPRPGEGYRTARSQLMGQMLAFDFETFSENAGAMAFGWGDPRARAFAEFIRAAVTADTARHVFAAVNRVDVSDLLPKIQAPTLVMSNTDIQYFPRQMSIDLAAQIPGARFMTRPGPTLADDPGSPEAILEFIEGWASQPSDEAPGSGTAIILFADIVDSTALTERLGDDAFREKARQLDATLRAAISANGGSAVEGKTLGDGVLAVFTSARQAINSAQECHRAAVEVGLALHAGIHAGDVIRESDNVYGGSVNIAARVAAASAAGETLVSQTVRDLARTSAGVTFEDCGEQSFKGIEEPVRIYSVAWRS